MGDEFVGEMSRGSIIQISTGILMRSMHDSPQSASTFIWASTRSDGIFCASQAVHKAGL